MDIVGDVSQLGLNKIPTTDDSHEGKPKQGASVQSLAPDSETARQPTNYTQKTERIIDGSKNASIEVVMQPQPKRSQNCPRFSLAISC
jgi:hypothetical protein